MIVNQRASSYGFIKTTQNQMRHVLYLRFVKFKCLVSNGFFSDFEMFNVSFFIFYFNNLGNVLVLQ